MPGLPAALTAAAAVVSAVGWFVAATWLPALPLTRPAKVAGIAVCVSAALSIGLALAGPHAALVLAGNKLAGAVAFAVFALHLRLLFRRAAAHRRAQAQRQQRRSGDDAREAA